MVSRFRLVLEVAVVVVESERPASSRFLCGCSWLPPWVPTSNILKIWKFIS